jgi:uncharacterized OB-fold protein
VRGIEETYVPNTAAHGDLFWNLDPPILQGGRDRQSGRYVFPFPDGDAALFERVPLHRHGTLWSYTVQRFRPKSPPYAGPEFFEPYAVGYVELVGQLILEARLVGVEFDELRIGMALRVSTIAYGDGGLARVHAFEPDVEEQQ